MPEWLRDYQPLTFSVIDIFPANVAGGQLHIAQGALRVNWVVNC
jgi:hypothetical protein